MQSGTEPPNYEEILSNPRWHRLTAGFRHAEVGALLVLAVPASAPNIEALVGASDGAILVGEGVPRRLPVSRVIASLRDASVVAEDAAARAATSAIAGLAAELDAAARRRWSTIRVAAAAGIILTLVLAGVGAWLAYRPLARSERTALGPKPDTTRGIGGVLAAPGPDTAVRDAAADSALAAAGTEAIPSIRNAADSAQAAAFCVELMAANTQAGAILKLQKDGKDYRRRRSRRR